MYKGNINKPLPATAPKWLCDVLKLLHLENLKDCETGRYSIRDDALFVNLIEINTIPADQRFPEAHDLFVDIHIVIEGEECIGITPRGNQQAEKDLRDQEDTVLFSPKLRDACQIILREGDFLVCTPQDIHRPGCLVNNAKHIRKAIVKVEISKIAGDVTNFGS